MKKTDFLYSLIKSLSSNEKRYFKLFASRHTIGEKNNYVSLFDTLDNEKDYNEEEIFKTLGNETLIKNFSFNKHYLYKLILKSLLQFHSDSSINAQLKDLLRSVEILFEKGLYDHCLKIIYKSYQLADQYENYLTHLELLSWEIKIIRTQLYRGKTEEDMDKVHQKIFSVIDKYKNFAQYNQLRAKMFLNKKEPYKNGRNLPVHQKMMQHPLLTSEDAPTTLLSKYIYNLINAIYAADVIHNYNLAISYNQKLIKLIEAHPYLIEEHTDRFMRLQMNIIVAHLYNKEYDKVAVSISKLKNLKSIKDQLFDAIYCFELLLYNARRQFEHAIKLVERIELNLQNRNFDYPPPPLEAELFYIISYTYFGTGNYIKALHWLNKIPMVKLESNPDLDRFIRMYNLILHYELKNQALMEYSMLSAHRFLDKKEGLLKVETIVLNFMEKLLNSNSKIEVKIFKDFKKEIAEAIKDSSEQKALQYFDIISWIDSTIKKKAFSEVIKAKAISYVDSK